MVIVSNQLLTPLNTEVDRRIPTTAAAAVLLGTWSNSSNLA
ncbi:MAG TPA: hypothetical protein VGM10_13845 [Actinocrinis sp.]